METVESLRRPRGAFGRAWTLDGDRGEPSGADPRPGDVLVDQGDDPLWIRDLADAPADLVTYRDMLNAGALYADLAALGLRTQVL